MTNICRIILSESQYEELQSDLFDTPDAEGAAFILCGQASDDGISKLIAREIVSIQSDDFKVREIDHLSIRSNALSRITKRARRENLSVIFAHSHPLGPRAFSSQDDQEERRLIPFLLKRVPSRLHGTVVMTPSGMIGRVYAPDRAPADILIVGDRLRLHTYRDGDKTPMIFDRQVRAFGADIQNTLSALHIGIVGVGGTGSAAAEQLSRLGIGKLSLFDGDNLEDTNVTRVYGSRRNQAGTPKVIVVKAHLDTIGTGTLIDAIPNSITEESVAKKMRSCDVIFGCTDKQLPRAILIQLALAYMIPVIDLGVLIDSENGVLNSVYGRITTIMPGEACLHCRGRITSEGMRIESLPAEERAHQVQEGYAPELEEAAPAVVSFTTTVAGFAISELFHRLTGFMGAKRKSSEVLISFDQTRIRTNRVSAHPDCLCGDKTMWGKGDTTPFLGMIWPTPPK